MANHPATPRLLPRFGATFIALSYTLVAILWIIVTDRVVNSSAGDADYWAKLQTLKGVLFVVGTGVFSWLLVRSFVRSLEKANRVLHERATRVRAMLDGAPVPLVVLREGRFEYGNAEAHRLLGDAVNERTDTFESLVEGDARARVTETLRRVETSGGSEWVRDVPMRGRGGRRFDAELAATPFALDTHAEQIVILDVTERRQLELAVRHAQKMEAVGGLAAGVAHEFNNMLTAILGLSSIARAEDGKTAPYLAQIEQVAEQASALTRSLLTMSRVAPSAKAPIALRTALENIGGIIHAAMPGSIRFSLEIAELGGAIVLADEGQLRQALLNLALNARDAMPRGGTLTLKGFTGNALGKPAAIIEMRDTGPGMSPETISQLYTPFFTTKPHGQGTGLGLPVTRGIIEEHSGTIDVESTLGLGTCFRITLPLAQDARP